MLAKFLLIILLMPLIGFILNGLFYKKISKKLIAFISCGAILVSFIFAIIVFLNLSSTNTKSFNYIYFSFIEMNNLNIPFALMIDHLNIIYVLIITSIGLLIHIYSIGYMYDDNGFGKYFSYLNLFVFSMLLLVLGSNYLILFIGWEGVGLCSFLLIGFWNHNKEYTLAARKAFIINRIGDLGFLLALFLLLSNFQTLNFIDIKQNINNISSNTSLINLITILMFIGATGKSAQLPLYTWLPDAMAGPTPVSALIHAATMVTAGIYLISRSHFIFDLSIITQNIITIIGLTTAFIAATIACVQKDIKKVLAYSTVSQLGFMFLSLGIGNYEGAIFHVITHAFFKALLFLGAGSVIHAMQGEQNMQFMGGLKNKLPITNITMLIACLAISGIPGFSGFFSKDNILMSVYNSSPILYFIALFIALLTSFYMFRMYFLTFYGTFRGTQNQESHLHESPLTMTIPLIILAIFSIIIGYINIPTLLGGNNLLKNYLESTISILDLHLSHNLEIILMTITFILIISIIIYSKKIFTSKNIVFEYSNKVFKFFYNKWYVDELYQKTIIKPIESLGNYFATFFEIKIIDSFIETTGKIVIWSSIKIRYLQAGKIGVYAFWMLLGIVIFIMLLLK